MSDSRHIGLAAMLDLKGFGVVAKSNPSGWGLTLL